MNTQLAEKFFSILEELRKIVANRHKTSELSKSEFSMLYLIKQIKEECDCVTTADISERLNITKPATSQMINLLEKKKFIERIINKEDRRLVLVLLTASGKKAIEEEMGICIKNVSMILGMMGDTDSKLFVELLEKYVSKAKELK